MYMFIFDKICETISIITQARVSHAISLIGLFQMVSKVHNRRRAAVVEHPPTSITTIRH